MVHAPEAELAWNLAKSRPTEAIDMARSLLRRLEADDPERAVALAAMGRARYELGDNDQAIIDLRQAVEAGRESIRDRATVALAAAVAAGGDNRSAADMLEAVIADQSDATGVDPTIEALAVSQLGLLRIHDGEITAATELLERAIVPLRLDPDEHDALARVLGNAGTCQLILGDLERASELFDEAVQLAERTDQRTVVAGCLQNRAYIHSLLGQFPEALTQLERARQAYDEIGGAARNRSTLFDDMADTYRLAGLTRDAVDHAEAALRSAQGGGNVEKEADALYRLAVCLLDDGDHRQAVETAKQADVMFGRADRSLWQTRATLVAVEAATADRLTATAEQVERIEKAAANLERSGWRTEALRLRNRMLLMGLAADDPGQVDRFLLDGDPEHDRSVVGRLEGLLHQAISQYHRSGRADGPLSHAEATLREHRSRLADPELRAGSGRLASAFRFVALAQELIGGDAGEILASEERWRAASLHLPRTRPSSDPAVADTTRQLREATRSAAEAIEPDPDLHRTIRRLEERLRRLSHQVTATISVSGVPADGATTASSGAALVDRIADRLGDQRFVEWFGHRGVLYAVDVDQAGGARVRELGSLTDVQSSANRLRRDLARQLQITTADEGGRRWERIKQRASDLGRVLLGDVEPGQGLVLSPPGVLQELPWSLMAPELGTAIVITYSASRWLQASSPIVEPAIHVVTGPDLTHSTDDHRAALASFRTTVAEADGGREAMADAIGQADLLHVAAHGRFRADNPMFSSVRLHDGDFALHELADFARVPAVVALAACDAGRSHHLEQGAEQLGTAPAWLSAGVETVVAPICAVPDETTAAFFSRFYGALPGRTPAEAIGQACAELADAGPQLLCTAAAFLCFGTGGPAIGRSPTTAG